MVIKKSYWHSKYYGKNLYLNTLKQFFIKQGKKSILESKFKEYMINPSIKKTLGWNKKTESKFIKCENKNVSKLKENGNDYCYLHKWIVHKQILKDEKMKAKQLEKEKKLLVKQLEKEKKLALALEKKNTLILCDAILKRGINKGLPCCKKAFENNKCKIHINFIGT